MKIAAIGCSHTTSYTENPWPNQLGKVLNAEIVIGGSPGAGLGICVDKLAYILSTEKIDHVFFQTPSDLRFCIGMNSKLKDFNLVEGNMQGSSLRNGNMFYTFIMTLVHGNKRALKALVDPDADEKLLDAFDKVWSEYFHDNFYETRINFVKKLWLVENLCKFHNVDYTIFTWHPFPWDHQNELFKTWKSKLNLEKYIPLSVIEYQVQNNMADKITERTFDKFTVDGYHFNDLGSLKLVTDYILPYYQKQKSNF